MTTYAVSTPDAPGGKGPYTEAEVRALVLDYYNANGHTALGRDVTVHAMTGGSTTGSPVDSRDFLPPGTLT